MNADLLVVGLLFFGLLLCGLWIPFAVAAGAMLWLLAAQGLPGLRAIGFVSWGSMNSFTLTAVPLFILMAEILLRSGLGHRVYRGLSRLASRLPGGLLQTNILGCAVFSAISGSSVATAAAIGTVAAPQLRERGYDMPTAYGSLAAGGTLGILIPPSIAMIIYGTFTETSITKLFMAGLVPGLLMTALFMAYIGARWFADRSIAPVERAPFRPGEWWETAGDVLPFAVLIVVVLGSLYFGYATPTEAAAVGTVAALGIAAIWAKLDRRVLETALANTVRVTASILFIVMAAYLFSYAITVTGLSRVLAEWVASLGLSRVAFLLVVFALYVVLGCFIESIAMIVITVPLLHPMLLQYGIDPVWFGVVLVILIELGQITPPFGINLFVIQSIGAARYETVVAGTWPYYLLMLAMIALLTLIPEFALWLPSQIAGR